jgi:hypothetical protein
MIVPFVAIYNNKIQIQIKIEIVFAYLQMKNWRLYTQIEIDLHLLHLQVTELLHGLLPLHLHLHLYLEDSQLPVVVVLLSHLLRQNVSGIIPE